MGCFFFAISSKIGKKTFTNQKMDWETERRSVYDSFMDMDHSSAVGCGDCRGSAFKQL